MKLSTYILLFIISVFSFSFFKSEKSERVAICNATTGGLKIETYPRLDEGVANKSICLKTNGDTCYWKLWYINAKVINYNYSNYYDTGRYIMMPESFFDIGFSFECGKNNFRIEDLKIHYLKVYFSNDTIVCNSKSKIMTLLNTRRFQYIKGDNVGKKYFGKFEHVIVFK